MKYLLLILLFPSLLQAQSLAVSKDGTIAVATNDSRITVQYVSADTSGCSSCFIRTKDYSDISGRYLLMYLCKIDGAWEPYTSNGQMHYPADVTVYSTATTRDKIGVTMVGWYVENGCAEDIPKNWVVKAVTADMKLNPVRYEIETDTDYPFYIDPPTKKYDTIGGWHLVSDTSKGWNPASAMYLFEVRKYTKQYEGIEGLLVPKHFKWLDSNKKLFNYKVWQAN